MAARTGPSAAIYDPSLAEYDFGPAHPMSPRRLDLTFRLAGELGVLDQLHTVAAPMATPEQLLRVHTEDFIEAVQRAGRTGVPDPRHGLGTEDDPIFTGMHEVSAHIVGGSIEVCRQVWTGQSQHAANIVGGLHHAMPGNASGFCIYNDVAAGIAWLLDAGAERVAYVDLDAHHGDGVERAFADDPRVLTISLHETGQMLFPGTGYATDIGGENARGYAVNVALPPGTADSGWLRAFHAVVPPLLREFKPQIVVSQHGCDSHAQDPLTHLNLSVDGHRLAYAAVHDLAHELTEGRWVAFGGGGYAVVEVVPRSWTHLLGLVACKPLDPSISTGSEWQSYVSRVCGMPPPLTMNDGREPAYRSWEQGFDPAIWLDRQINATRTAVFPWHGLDPLP